MKQGQEIDQLSRGARQSVANSGRVVLGLLLALAVPAHLRPQSAAAQTTKANAGEVQAAYLFNFGKFVKWPAVAPANQSGAFTICVFDDDPFGAVLQSTLAGESLGGKPVAVKRIARVQDATACHILFISSAQGKELKAILSAIDESAVLTVSDIPDFSKRGGMIQFVLEGNRLRFEINLEGTERSHLVLPSELLKVAVAVKKPARTGD